MVAETEDRILGHIKYVTAIVGKNYAAFFEHIYRQFKMEDLKELHRLLNNKYPKLGEGSTRATYAISATKAIKVPGGNIGYQWAEFSATLTELIVYNRLKHRKVFTKAKLYFYKSVPVLLVDRVIPLKWEELDAAMSLPKFNGLSDGKRQLGTSRHGEILCFDFGLEEQLVEEHKRDLTPKELNKLQHHKKKISPLLSVK